MPRGVRGLQEQVLDAHELTALAAVTGNRAALLRAMMTDPLCNNISDAKACIAELLAAERDALPAYWRKKPIRQAPSRGCDAHRAPNIDRASRRRASPALPAHRRCLPYSN